MRVFLLVVGLMACGGGHESAHDDGPGASASHSDDSATQDDEHGAPVADSPAAPTERPTLPGDVSGVPGGFLPSIGADPAPASPDSVAVATADDRARVAGRKPAMASPIPPIPVGLAPGLGPLISESPSIVVVSEGPSLPTIDMRSPLTTARSVLWRFLLGMIVLVGVHTLVARARRRLPKLQDDLLMVQLFSVIATLLVTAGAIIQALEHASPVVAGGSLVAIGLAVVVVGARFLPRYIEGLYLMLGPSVRVGDWVSFGDDSGTLAEVGLIRITLVREDGRRFSIPVASLGGARFSVQPRDHSSPVDVIVPAGKTPERVRAHMLAAAQMSPYRDPETPVSAVVTGEQLRVHFVAWSPDVVEHAIRHLRASRTRIDERHALI
ncbi:MAG: hypothetical protein ACJATT_002450 [Myxococcota bacterium]|jgi:hypothetical protein